MNIGRESGLIPVVIGSVLVIFGIFYDYLVSYLHRQGHSEGYTSLLVVAGVLVTVVAAGPVIGWLNVLWLLIFFACSGAPMVVGDIGRYVRSRREFEERQANGRGE